MTKRDGPPPIPVTEEQWQQLTAPPCIDPACPHQGTTHAHAGAAILIDHKPDGRRTYGHECKWLLPPPSALSVRIVEETETATHFHTGSGMPHAIDVRVKTSTRFICPHCKWPHERETVITRAVEVCDNCGKPMEVVL